MQEPPLNCKHILVRINGDALVHLQPVDAAGLATAGKPFEACHFPRFFFLTRVPIVSHAAATAVGWALMPI